MRKLIFIALFFLSILRIYAQHDNLYSQYMFNGLLINPAYAGSTDVLNATFVNRNQWVGFDGAPRTSTFSLHTPFKNKKINIGLTFTNDQFGITTQNKIDVMGAYRLFFKKSSLSFGLQVGMNFIKNNWNTLQTITPGDQAFMGPYSSHNVPQTGFGLYYKAQKFYIGLSSPDMVAISTSKTTYKSMLFTAGYLFDMSDNIKIKPSFLIKYIRNSPLEIDINAIAYFKMIGIGYSYRSNDAMVFLATVNVNKQLSFGYSYDLTTSKLSTYVRGSHEIMLKYEFSYKVNPQSPRYF